jgi:hypothetical protein
MTSLMTDVSDAIAAISQRTRRFAGVSIASWDPWYTTFRGM